MSAASSVMRPSSRALAANGCAREDAHPDPYIRHGWFQALQKGHFLFHVLRVSPGPPKSG